MCRFRGGEEPNPLWVIKEDGKTVVPPPTKNIGKETVDSNEFTFDHVLDSHVTQAEMYKLAFADRVQSVI